MNNGEYHSLELNDDESYHLHEITDVQMGYLSLAYNAAVLSLNGLMSVSNPPVLNSPKGIIHLLLAKSAKTVRFASLGAKLGYYSGSYAVTRSALEALKYAALFDKDPNEVNKFFIHEFLQSQNAESDKDRNEQLKRAEDDLLDLETKRLAIKDGLHDLLHKANHFLHFSMAGLAAEFGFDIGYIVPEDFQVELEKAGEDYQKAVNQFKLDTKFGKNILEKQNAKITFENEELNLELAGRYDKSIIEDLAIFIFYIAHRILDMVKGTFRIDNEDFHLEYKKWHDDIKELGDFHSD